MLKKNNIYNFETSILKKDERFGGFFYEHAKSYISDSMLCQLQNENGTHQAHIAEQLRCVLSVIMSVTDMFIQSRVQDVLCILFPNVF